MTDAEYQDTRARVEAILDELTRLDAWRFKHAAKARGQRTFGQWVWTLHLEAREAERVS